MAMAETVRARAEELRSRVMTRLAELRGQTGGVLGGQFGGQMQILKGPLISEIRAKGVVATARERLEKLRAGGPVLGGQKAERGTVTETKPAAVALVAKRGEL